MSLKLSVLIIIIILLLLMYLFGVIVSTYYAIWTIEKKGTYNTKVKEIERHQYTNLKEIETNNILQLIVLTLNTLSNIVVTGLVVLFYYINNNNKEMDVVDIRETYKKNNIRFVTSTLYLMVLYILIMCLATLYMFVTLNTK